MRDVRLPRGRGRHPVLIHPVTGEVLSTQEEYLSALRAVEEEMQPFWKIRREIREAYAEEFEAAAQPAPRYRTTTQEKVSRCPRCGGILEREEAP